MVKDIEHTTMFAQFHVNIFISCKSCVLNWFLASGLDGCMAENRVTWWPVTSSGNMLHFVQK